jgi:cytoskeletal protein CcmA (bactofilin family)
MIDKNGQTTGKHTLVEEGTEFTGTLSSKCPIVVMGKVEGEITGPQIHVTTTGVVAGNVKVKELRSDGELAGQVEADAVHISGRVRDRTVIRARTLEVSLVSTDRGMEVVFGECELAIGDAPDKAAALAAATAKAEAANAAAANAGAAKSPEPMPEVATPPVAVEAKVDPSTTDAEPAKVKGDRHHKRSTQPPPT